MAVNEYSWAYIAFEQLDDCCPDAASLRRWITAAFPDRPLLHQHEPGKGRPIYQYPLVQYKVIEGLPVLFGVGEGAEQVHEICSLIQCEEVRFGGHVIRDMVIRGGRMSLTEGSSRHGWHSTGRITSPILSVRTGQKERSCSIPCWWETCSPWQRR